MKKFLVIFCILYSSITMAQPPSGRVFSTDYSYSHVGNKYTFYLFSQFTFGSGEGPHVSGYLTQKSNDTLYVKALYNTVGVWAHFYGVSDDTIRNIEKDNDVNYFNVSSNSYYYNKDSGVKSDTAWNDDDTTFNVGPTAIQEIKGENLFSVFPNPAAGQISIRSAQSLQWSMVKVYNTFGQLVVQQDRKQMDIDELNISELSSGLYFLSLHDKNRISLGGTKFYKQ